MRHKGFNRVCIVTAGILFLISISSFAQNIKLLDSLKNALRFAPIEEQFDLLNSVGFEYRYSFPDSTIHYCTKAYELGKQLKVEKTLARPLSFIGLAMANQGDYKSALEYQNRSLSVALSQRDTLQLAHGYNNVGRIFFDEGDLVRAYTNFVSSRELFVKLHDKSGLAYVYRSLATLFKSQNDFKKALENSEKALALRKELGDPRAITSAYMELGLVYEEMDSTPLALKQFHSADSIAVAVNDQITKAELKIGIAEIYFIENRIKEAEAMASEVLSVVTEKTNQKIFLRSSLLSARCKLKNKKNPEALYILTMIYESSEKSGNLVFQRDAAQLLSSVYDNQKLTAKSKEFLDVYQILNQRIQNADLNREVERLQFQLLIEKTEKENASLKAKQIEDESLIVRQRSQNLLLWIVAIFVAALAIVIWRVSQRRKLLNQTLEGQNLHIKEQREEIAKQNEILSKSNKDLDVINHEKDTLMNIVAHDLKSPLNRIHGLVRIMELEGNLNENQHQYIRMVKDSTRGGLDLITDLLDVHAWNELREDPPPLAFDFDQFFTERVLSFQVVAEAKGIKLVLKSDVEHRIFSEPDYIGRILDNLISNAIKFSVRNTTIEVSASWANDTLKISIKDGGPGFSEEDKRIMFQKFKKLSARPTAGESSNGLGLAIVKTLVDRLGGMIELKTSSAKGSEFIIEIPAKIAQQVPV
ncbi:MAG: tetratricopeptide repeat-containing sensor histidine kinase [Cyclobacteriaceae bacterium]|nr:tetratricopeptide repeat-containing sensor histidine kinase [Cyclobacteriaceae bacterium]